LRRSGSDGSSDSFGITAGRIDPPHAAHNRTMTMTAARTRTRAAFLVPAPVHTDYDALQPSAVWSARNRELQSRHSGK
jgi:nicotinic acid mononucleotide adenylyltransferase